MQAGGNELRILESVQQRMHYIQFKGREVLKSAVNIVTDMVKETAKKNKIELTDIA